jgi:glycosyltransferase involved in cell wall biosynthesis
MRLAIITTHPPGTGTLNEYAYHLIRALRQKLEVHEIILLTDQLPDKQHYTVETAAVPMRIIPCWQFDSLSSAPRILAVLLRERPDAVLFNIQFASFGRAKIPGALGLFTPALARIAGFPTIVLLHNITETIDLKQAGFAHNQLIELLIRRFGEILTRILLQAHLVALTIPRYVELLAAKYQAHNLLLAPHGSFDEPPEPDFTLPDGRLQIMAFGKFGTYKRIEHLIAAFQQLCTPDRPALELVIAGTDSPNASGYLERMRQRYAHLPKIRFTGYVAEADVPQLFREAAVVVFPYTSTTGSSGVLHQAGSFAKAVVLPRLGDLADLLEEEGYVGEYFAPDSAASMAAAIARVIDNPAKRVEHGMRNYLAARGLPIADVADWYLLHFQQLLRERSTPILPSSRERSVL